jgi:small nuclear ribonucleoprotein E
MTGRGGGNRGKVLLPPINFIFKLLQQHSTVSIWLFEQLAIRIEGKIRVHYLLWSFFLLTSQIGV